MLRLNYAHASYAAAGEDGDNDVEGRVNENFDADGVSDTCTSCQHLHQTI